METEPVVKSKGKTIIAGILGTLLTMAVVIPIAVAIPLGVYWYNYEQQTTNFRQQYVTKFTDAHNRLVNFIYDWRGDDHTKEEQAALSEVVGDAFSAANNYEIFVEANPYLQSYQWALISIKNAMYDKTWGEQNDIITTLVHLTYAQISP